MRNNHPASVNRESNPLPTPGPFIPGAIVLVTLSAPREKFWGGLLSVSPAGISIRGIDLNSFDDFIRQVKAGDPVAPHTVFFPMHRIDRMEIDVRDGEIPSLQERFQNKCGIHFEELVTGARVPTSEPSS